MMKKWKEKAASKAGFTLVELIVVIAVLAILAAVAIPTYSGYIKKANEASDYSVLDAVKTAAVFAAVDKNTPKATDVTEITVTSGDSEVKVKVSLDGATATEQTIDISDYCEVPEFKSGAATATWTSSSAKWTLNPASGG